MVTTTTPTGYSRQKNSSKKVNNTVERFSDRWSDRWVEFLCEDFSFTQNYPSSEKTNLSLLPPLPLDPRTQQFCEDNDLTQAFRDIVEKIYLFYKDCHLTVSLEVDPEIPDYYILRIEITSDDSIENLLDSERQFHGWFVDNISTDKQGFFAITYKI